MIARLVIVIGSGGNNYILWGGVAIFGQYIVCVGELFLVSTKPIKITSCLTFADFKHFATALMLSNTRRAPRVPKSNNLLLLVGVAINYWVAVGQ